jgi:hypothetical protein
MTTTVSEFFDLGAKLRELGCREPDGIALLPINIEQAASIGELRQVSEAATVKTLLRNAGLEPQDIIDRPQRPPYIQNNAFEWIAPTLFVTAALLSDNPQSVSVALSMIANYATDFFRGMTSQKTVKLDIVVEQKGSKSYKKVSYQGPPDGLKDLADVVRSAADDR